ncbi:hypothetical protein HELRODRAFT_170739 [Helobdella robusta]|uniref:Uncharacterized protein n=1 Tax=Helobdella robusta TaxID=6412 RepID=T1F3D4_HELRO|nr:hypothetical protein HELRODRAFT_170739 [Helobdella robusta]ESO07405.1 hypothetical protein HELRODRAFT_170739 [Helobdella robusta]
MDCQYYDGQTGQLNATTCTADAKFLAVCMRKKCTNKWNVYRDKDNLNAKYFKFLTKESCELCCDIVGAGCSGYGYDEQSKACRINYSASLSDLRDPNNALIVGVILGAPIIILTVVILVFSYKYNKLKKHQVPIKVTSLREENDYNSNHSINNNNNDDNSNNNDNNVNKFNNKKKKSKIYDDEHASVGVGLFVFMLVLLYIACLLTYWNKRYN